MVGENKAKVVSIKIEAELESMEPIKKLFNNISKGSTIQLCDESAELTLLTEGDTLSFSGGFDVELLLSFSFNVASSIVGSLIFSAICTGIKKLEINGRRTRITEENITQTIEELVISSETSKGSEEDSNKNE